MLEIEWQRGEKAVELLPKLENWHANTWPSSETEFSAKCIISSEWLI